MEEIPVPIIFVYALLGTSKEDIPLPRKMSGIVRRLRGLLIRDHVDEAIRRSQKRSLKILRQHFVPGLQTKLSDEDQDQLIHLLKLFKWNIRGFVENQLNWSTPHVCREIGKCTEQFLMDYNKTILNIDSHWLFNYGMIHGHELMLADHSHLLEIVREGMKFMTKEDKQLAKKFIVLLDAYIKTGICVSTLRRSRMLP